MNITIEKVEYDNPDLVRLWNEAWDELINKGALAKPPINGLNGIFFLLKADDKIVGIRTYNKITSVLADSYLTYVEPNYRGMRISYTTRELVFEELKKLGFTRLTTIVNVNSTEMINNFKSLEIEPSAYRYEWDI